MAIDTTRIMREVENIVEQGQTVSQKNIECQLLIGDQRITPVMLDMVSNTRDYETGYGDELVVQVVFSMGVLAYDIIPNRDDLLIELTYITLDETTHQQQMGSRIPIKRYRAVLMGQDNPGLDTLSPQMGSRADFDKMGLKEVEFQLLEESLYQVRMQTVGRTFRRITPMDALRAVLTESTQLLSLRRQQLIFGVDTVGGFNEAVREQIIIPPMSLTDVAGFLQQREGGIYGAGCGCFLQDGFWYVYPLYDPTRHRNTPGTLTIVRVPPNRFMGAERTYRVDGQQVVLVAAGNVEVVDNGYSQQLNEGNAARFLDARRLLNGYGETEENRYRVSRRDNVFEVEGNALKTGLTNARWSMDEPTSNPFVAYTDMARRNGREILVEWTHANYRVLYPGMPVKYITVVDGAHQQYEGVLLGVQEQRLPASPGAQNTAYPATCMLRVFLTRTYSI